ncbi:MAG: PIG-L family deacetylase [Chloroflexi bacterium]|nr:PIG-L family deacetylase [Chloroflexota bacterium]
MTHVFIAPHADDVALSCGGLIASLRELGQSVSIITVFSGAGAGVEAGAPLTGYQREALGFGSKALWPATEAFNRADIAADFSLEDPGSPPWAATEERLEATQQDADASAKRFWQRASWYRRASIRKKPLAGQVLVDDVPTQGPTYTDTLVEAAAAGEIMAERRLEDERFAYFAEASIVFLDLPDAVFRGYEGDGELLGAPREDDEPPTDVLRREIARLEPQVVYLPLGVGNHVDHVLCREAGLALVGEGRRWVMPGPEWAGNLAFYEDFPYAWWHGFTGLDDLPEGALDALPRDVLLTPRYAEVSDQLERKIRGISLYASQLDRLFGGEAAMASAVRRHGSATAAAGGLAGSAERYWHTFVP